MDSMNSHILGILGGLGPMSGIRFCEMLTDHTLAATDQEHINFLLSSRADTPDRTAFILGKSKENPSPVMQTEVKRLIAAGADRIVIPCNTAHYFYREIAKVSSVPVLNIIDRTADFCAFCGMRRIGVLATEGTAASGAYRSILESRGMEYLSPTKEEQATVTHIIYGEIKSGMPPHIDRLLAVADSLFAKGADTVILGCTELSLLKPMLPTDRSFTDSLEVLAACAIRSCGRETVGFDPSLTRFAATLSHKIEIHSMM
ncbi:MAG: aspartate/glutamate racemase family protein [Clostridia bacterium]|nr:aspartate/glutamate racemase family protein [Clostridia bacterium]